jgi:hypothetical protein
MKKLAMIMVMFAWIVYFKQLAVPTWRVMSDAKPPVSMKLKSIDILGPHFVQGQLCDGKKILIPIDSIAWITEEPSDGC